MAEMGFDKIAPDAGLPKYVRARHAIMAAIRDGRFPAGSRLPAERILAEQLGIAYLTVRRAVAGLAGDGVLERRPGVGTFVCARTQGANVALVFFVVRHMEPGSLAWMEVESVRVAAQARGRILRVLPLVKPPPPPSQVIDELRLMDVGAVGLVGFLESHRAYVERLAHEIPCVLFNKSLPGLPLPCAKSDVAMGARLMVDYFSRRGRRTIGVAVSDADHPQQRELLISVEAELARRGLPINKRHWFEGRIPETMAELAHWLQRLINSDNRPDALIIQHVTPARCLEAMLRDRGECRPDDLDVIAVCDLVGDEQFDLPWPVLLQDYPAVVKNAQELLLNLVEDGGNTGGAPVLLTPPRLVCLRDGVPAATEA